MKFSILRDGYSSLREGIRATHVIHPPSPAPRKMISCPFPSTILVAWILRKLAIVDFQLLELLRFGHVPPRSFYSSRVRLSCIKMAGSRPGETCEPMTTTVVCSQRFIDGRRLRRNERWS